MLRSRKGERYPPMHSNGQTAQKGTTASQSSFWTTLSRAKSSQLWISKREQASKTPHTSGRPSPSPPLHNQAKGSPCHPPISQHTRQSWRGRSPALEARRRATRSDRAGGGWRRPGEEAYQVCLLVPRDTSLCAHHGRASVLESNTPRQPTEPQRQRASKRALQLTSKIWTYSSSLFSQIPLHPLTTLATSSTVITASVASCLGEKHRTSHLPETGSISRKLEDASGLRGTGAGRSAGKSFVKDWGVRAVSQRAKGMSRRGTHVNALVRRVRLPAHALIARAKVALGVVRRQSDERRGVELAEPGPLGTVGGDEDVGLGEGID